MCRCSNFKYWSVKILLLKLASELPNLVKNFQFVLKVWTKSKLNFHEVEYTRPFCCGNRFSKNQWPEAKSDFPIVFS